MDQEIATIQSYLSSLSLHVSSDWLEGCINFFRSENVNGYARAQLEAFVLEQWKLADLREMGEACLPPNLSAKIKVMLPGKYGLQVESVVDIAAPCYGQLQKIRKVATENLEVSETKTQTWEPKPTRMFKLMLCDGLQEIMAIEYRPIRSLDQLLIPGCKVVVIGPVECRRGVVLLQEHNLQILGGEVDSLLIKNALENLLARKLNLEENPQPYLNGLPPPEVPTHTQVNLQSSTGSTAVQPNRPVAQVAPMAAHDFNDDDILHCSELDEIERRFQQEMDDVPDDMIADEENLADYVPKGWNVGSRQTTTSRLTGIPGPPDTIHNRSKSSNGHKQFQSDSYNVLTTNNCALPVGGSSANLHSVNDINVQKNNSSGQKQSISDVGPSLMKFNTNSIGDLDDFDYDFFKDFRHSSRTGPSMVNTSDDVDLLEQDDELLLDISSQDLDATTLPAQNESSHSKPSTKQNARNLCKKLVQQNQSKLTSFISKNHAGIGNCSDTGVTIKKSAAPTALKRPPTSPLKSNIFAPQRKIFLEQIVVGCDDEVTASHSAVSKKPGSAYNKSCSSFSSVETSQKMVGKVGSTVEEQFVKRHAEKSVGGNDVGETLHSCALSLVMEHKPFVYLSQLRSFSGTNFSTFTVKAFVLTLVSQLVLKKEGWHLLCKINDGSTVMQVAFSSEVLEKLIGYTPAEIRVLRQQMATNPSIKEKIKGALLDAQKKLVNLNCLLDLTFSCHSDVPVVTAISEVDREHVALLSRRLQVLSRAVGVE